MIRRLAVLCVVAFVGLACVPLLAQGHGEAFHDSTVYELPAGRTSATIPFVHEVNQVRVDARVNGNKPLRLVVDTGMPTPGVLLFRSESVDALELTDVGEGPQVGGAGDSASTVTARLASASRVELGDLVMGEVPVILLERPSGFPADVDGIIGGALFFRFTVRVDFDRSRLEMIEPTSFVPAEGASLVPIRRMRGFAFIPARVTVEGKESVETELVIDLGAGHSLSLNTADGIAPPANAIETAIGRGLLAPLYGKVARVKALELGEFRFDDVVATFPVAAKAHPGASDARGGNLGAGILKRFNVTFDYAQDRLVLEKSARFTDPFEHDMTGLALDTAYGKEREIITVVADSPAAAAGIVAGDVLVGVDGHDMAEFGEDELRRRFKIPGAELTLTLRNGTVERQVRITLRRLV